MQLQGSGSGGISLQGGTGVQQAAPSQLQPAIDVMAPNAVQSASTTNYPSGGTGGTGYVAPVDPYGPGGQYYAQSQAYNTGLNAINTTSANAFTSLYDNLMASADQIGTQNKSSQLGIDQSRENNQLNRMNGLQDILSYVRNGLQSGGAQLASMNAGDSSATGALSRAYNLLGAQQARSVNNQSALTDRSINTQQSQLALSNQSSTSQLQRYRDSQVQNIATDLAQRLAALDQQAAGLSLPGKVNIDAQKAQLVAAGQAQVGQVDGYLSNLLNSVKPEAADQVLASANQLRTSGASLPNPFTTALNQPSLGIQQSGPALDQLPLLLNPVKSKTTT